jgi:hypothetical protein
MDINVSNNTITYQAMFMTLQWLYLFYKLYLLEALRSGGERGITFWPNHKNHGLIQRRVDTLDSAEYVCSGHFLFYHP